MEVLESNCGDNAFGPLYDCADGSLNFKYLFFGCGVVYTKSLHDIICSLAKLHIHKKSLYYHATSVIYFKNLFLIFTHLLSLAGWYVFDSRIFLPGDILIRNGAHFTNITYSTRVTNL